jgi:peptidoglycan/xylan/chitin deacetylase (PgdA/CDA1 family)
VRGFSLKKVAQYAFILLTLGALGYGQFWMRRASAPQLFGEAVRQVHTSEKVMALTYDDGPNPPYTEMLLDILAQYNNNFRMPSQ